MTFKSRMWLLAGVLFLGLAVFGSIFFVRFFVLQAFKAASDSMNPTLLAGDYFFVNKTAAARNPKRGDVIVFKFPEDPQKDFVMRVIAIGGDKVEIRNKSLLLNGKPVVENYTIHNDDEVIPGDKVPRDYFGPVTVPRDAFFVLGDNRDNSRDSRFWGFVDQAKVKGTVTRIYFSIDKEKSEIRWDRFGKMVR